MDTWHGYSITEATIQLTFGKTGQMQTQRTKKTLNSARLNLNEGVRALDENLGGSSKTFNPFLYPVVFGALLAIKVVTKHFFHHPEPIQAVLAVGIGVACFRFRPKPARSFVVYVLLVVALSIGYAYPNEASEIFRRVLSKF
jgi:hypothetical protein